MGLKINVYVDDEREAPEGFILAKTVEEAKNYVIDHEIGKLSLDHDLGILDGEIAPTGYDFVKWFCQENKDMNLSVEEIYIHTDNGGGRDAMYHTLLGAQRRDFISEGIDIYHHPMNNDPKKRRER